MVVFSATVFRDREDPNPTTGWAYEREGVGYVNKTSFIENCETSAIGRALANLNFPTSRSQRKGRVGSPATKEQLDELRALAASEVVSEVRERVLARLDAGMTARQAVDAIAYLRRIIGGRSGWPEPCRSAIHDGAVHEVRDGWPRPAAHLSFRASGDDPCG